ncbi:Imm1 family immunity protein [Allokutzneria sp. NRRL B-24872]|uniref:Imm1 family immunity protein n=1 Tax=Allokutzneria sp. NRRL B-24872 TaxID=1137961 RepID=UPI000A3A92C5|nr:Imm1 family immunity protein [Allokutzneria sp. NRRL B-24872]
MTSVDVSYRSEVGGKWLEHLERINATLFDRMLAGRLPEVGKHGAIIRHRHRPVDDRDPSERELIFGVRNGRAALYYTDETGAWYSRGPTPASPDELVYADLEFPAHCEISLINLAHALAEFFDTQTRPTCVSWQESDF